MQPHQARERRLICTTGNLPWFIINSLKETDRLLSLRFLKNKLLANFPVTVLSTLCFECCRYGYACDMLMVCLVVQLPLVHAPACGAYRAVDRTCRPRRRRSAAPFRRVVSTLRARGSLIIIIIQAFIVRSRWVRHGCHPTHLVDTLLNRSSARLSCPDPTPNLSLPEDVGHPNLPPRSLTLVGSLEVGLRQSWK